MFRVYLLLAALAATSCWRFESNACEPYCECSNSEDCGPDLVCYLGVCQDQGWNSGSAYFEVIPPASSGYLPQADSNSPHDLSTGLRIDLPLQSSTLFSGTVRDAGGNPVPGVLIASLQNPDSIAIPSLATEHSVKVTNLGFALPLVPGTYSTLFMPENATLPPITYANIELLYDQQMSLVYPSPHELVLFRGKLVDRNQNPIVGVWLSGASTSKVQPYHSTQAMSDATGYFELRFPPGVTTFQLSMRTGLSETTRAEAVIANVAAGPTLLNIPADISLATTLVNLQVRKASGDPASQMDVVIEGVISQSASGTLKITDKTDLSGSLNVHLVPGNYLVSIVPQVDDLTMGVTSVPLCVETTLSGVSFGCVDPVANHEVVTIQGLKKIKVTGTIYADDGDGLSGMRVQFTPQSKVTPRIFDATTDLFGRYNVWIDEPPAGASVYYNMVVEPLANTSPQPRHFEVVEGAWLRGGQHDVALPPFSFVHGKVRTSKGVPLSDAIVSVYAYDREGPDGPLLLGVGHSIESGEFVIPIPVP